ncbi:Vinculin/alpha-catenin [Gonapodya prolifera JEL478]|uniref:Vinculin/alpha-catenin n=1 Tax=Gonapodya prolifera (strain JEL478) TaxID=1344416 RepID=A0A139AHQ0_GONPJ|nr:Vinculin/alpha-catenin [Gonapodya prolifera JEL478]|eukprot:KXS16352.1 Vinculin/alpha-catenin [Gonapodya prolifera JEL478]
MKSACASVTDSGITLLFAANLLKEDPYSSDGRASMLDALKGILQGTTCVLSVTDDVEVRRIVRVCDEVSFALEALRKPLDPTSGVGEVQPLALRTKQTTQLLVNVLTAINRRAKDLLSSRAQDTLRIAAKDVETYGVLLGSALKSYLTLYLTVAALAGAKSAAGAKQDVDTTGLDDAARSKDMCVAKLVATVALMKETVLLKEFDEVSGGDVSVQFAPLPPPLGSTALSSLAPRVVLAVESQDTAQVGKLVQDAVKVSKESAERTAASGNTLSPESSSTETITSATTAISDLHPALLALPHTTPLPSRAAADTLLSLLVDRHRALESLTHANAVSNVADGLASCEAATAELEKAVDARSATGAEAASRELQAGVENLASSVDAAVAASGSQDPAHTARISRLVSSLVISAPLAGAAARAAVLAGAEGPAKVAATEHWAAVSGGVKTELAALRKDVVGEGGVFEPSAVVAGHATSLAREIDYFDARMAAKDAPGAAACLPAVERVAGTMTAAVRREVEKAQEGEYKEGLGKELSGVEAALGKVSAASHALAALPMPLKVEDLKQASQATDDLRFFTAHLAEQVAETHTVLRRGVAPIAPSPVDVRGGVVEEAQSALVEVAEEPSVEKKGEVVQVETAAGLAAPETINGVEVMVVEGAEPEKAGEEEEKRSPLKAAAKNLRAETSQWTSHNNPIVGKASSLSSLLEQLSDAYARLKVDHGNPALKKELITLSQRIAKESAALIAEVAPVSTRCPDARLKQDLDKACERVATLGSQMRVTAAVKASNPSDNDADGMVIGCARNLVAAAAEVLRRSEAASLRVAAFSVGVAVVKFKRNVFRRKAGGHAKVFERKIAE